VSAPRVDLVGLSPRELVDRQVADRVASRLGAADPTLWGPDAEAEARIRLGWVRLHESSRPLLAEIEGLQAELRAEGLDRIVLCGMGGSSLAPEVITRTAGTDLTVLDTTDPGAVRRSLADRLDRTVVVVSSKSGSTVETDSQRRAFEAAFQAAGIDAPTRMVAVTDPGSQLAEHAEQAGWRRTFLADSSVGGRFSALTPFGLVPSGLAGADVAALLDDAAAAADAVFLDDPANPALVLGAVMGAAHASGRHKLVIGEHDSGVLSFGAWAEQLIAESTGKLGRGVLPVDVGSVAATGWLGAGQDAVRVALGGPVEGVDEQVATSGPLGGQLLLWEAATAVAGRMIGINPFDQPNVEDAKNAARSMLDAPAAAEPDEPPTTDGAVEVHGPGADAAGALSHLLDRVPEGGYLAVLAYLDPVADATAADLREVLGRRLGRQVTFGWGPRYLHSTGQYHKGGHPDGAFLVLTGAVTEDLDVAGRPYTFGRLIAAQAAGDAGVLAGQGLPVLRLHLTDRTAGLRQVLAAAEADR